MRESRSAITSLTALEHATSSTKGPRPPPRQGARRSAGTLVIGNSPLLRLCGGSASLVAVEALGSPLLQSPNPRPANATMATSATALTGRNTIHRPTTADACVVRRTAERRITSDYP